MSIIHLYDMTGSCQCFGTVPVLLYLFAVEGLKNTLCFKFLPQGTNLIVLGITLDPIILHVCISGNEVVSYDRNSEEILRNYRGGAFVV
jgi:hypothetical protein